MDDIERVIGKVESVYISGRERDVGQVALLSLGESVVKLVDSGYQSGRNPGG